MVIIYAPSPITIKEKVMIPKLFDEISLLDIEALLNGCVPESKTIEYKRELPHEGESKKIPFLAEISAFANTMGGDIVFGLEEKDGIPLKITGVELSDPDTEILRLDNAILNGIEPRIPQLSIKTLKTLDSKQILVIRVWKSWAAPHRVSYKDHSKFYGRNTAGKYPLDVNELRAAFTLSELLVDRIRNFRESRITDLHIGRELPVFLAEGGKLAFHIVPLSAFSGPDRNQMSPTSKDTVLFPPIGAGGWNHRINLDGLVMYDRVNEKARTYTQAFRSGSIESAVVLKERDGHLLLPSEWYEKEILEASRMYLSSLKKFGINGPIYIFLSLIDMKGFRLGMDYSFIDQGKVLDRDLVLIPEIMIDDQIKNLPATFKPVFDIIWNAFGYERSSNYDEAGNWRYGKKA